MARPRRVDRVLDSEIATRAIPVLRGLMESRLVGFAMGDSEGNVVEVNDAFAGLLGYDRTEFLESGLNWRKFTPPEYAGLDTAARQEMERLGHSRAYPKEYIRRDGSRVPVLIVLLHTTSERDEHAVFVLDDSARRGAEESLRRTEEMYHQILDAIPDLVLLKGADSRIEWANRAFLDFHAATQDVLQGHVTPPIRPVDARNREIRDDAVVLETGMTVDLPQEARRRADGVERIFHTVKSPVTRSDGRITHTIAVSRDVTDRARAEQALQRSETNLRTAQSLASIGSWELHVPYRQEDYWSEEAFRIVGLDPSDAPPASAVYIDQIVHPEDRDGARKALEETVRDGQPLDHEYRIVRPDGALRWVRSQGSALPRLARVGRTVVGTIRDVTEQKHAEAVREALEARLRQAQKLEAVGTLAGGIAHDFNNILGALSGYTELALDATRENPRAQNDLTQVLKAAYRAADLVSRILTFSRQQEHSRARLRIEAPVREALQLLRATLPSTIEIRETYAKDAPDVLADETQILQVVMNLGTNALHAMASRGGTLSVAIEPFRVDARFAGAHPELRQGRHARITVADSGCGIDAAVLDRVLEPFFTTKPPGQGTGLGLSVVHGIVHEHGGSLEVESTPEAGTRVRILLPGLPEQDQEASPGAEELARGRGERVLVVDDERALAELGRRRLEELGYLPQAFTDAREALEAFRRRPDEFDLVITDYTMPKLTGMELAREIRRIRADVPVVLVSGYGDAVRAGTLAEAGIRCLLSKPVAITALAEAMRAALDMDDA